MSSPAQHGPAVPAPAEKKGLSKVVARMKTVLRRSDGSRRLSFAAPKPAAAESSLSTPQTSSPAQAPAIPTMATLPSTTVNPDGPQPVRVLRSEINAERARKLGERFKLTFDAEEWVTAAGPGKEEAWRIEKPIRMRVHRTCHKCSTTFGGNKICAGCQHNRCTKCPRYPVKKSKDREKEAASVVPVHGITIEVDNCWNLQDDIVLTMPSKRVGGQPLVRKKPVQRVRRTCHACSAMFPPGSKICTGCSHVRCTDCPRDPAKKKKYPNGYPGDVPSLSYNAYACHLCDKLLPPTEDGAPPSECTRCTHVKCESCALARPRKITSEPDPRVTKSMEAKLMAIRTRSFNVATA